MRTKRIKIVEKWVAGWNRQGDLIAAKGRFRVTKKYLIRQDGTNDVAPFLAYERQLSKDDKRLHDTRRAAINYLLLQQNSQLEKAYQDLEKIHARIRTLIGELTHDPSEKVEEAGDPAANKSPEG